MLYGRSPALVTVLVGGGGGGRKDASSAEGTSGVWLLVGNIWCWIQDLFIAVVDWSRPVQARVGLSSKQSPAASPGGRIQFTPGTAMALPSWARRARVRRTASCMHGTWQEKVRRAKHGLSGRAHKRPCWACQAWPAEAGPALPHRRACRCARSATRAPPCAVRRVPFRPPSPPLRPPGRAWHAQPQFLVACPRPLPHRPCLARLTFASSHAKGQGRCKGQGRARCKAKSKGKGQGATGLPTAALSSRPSPPTATTQPTTQK